MEPIRFSDQVMAFGTEQGRLHVLFMQHAAQYAVPTGHPDFVRLAGALAEAWRRQAPARFAVQGTDIVDIDLS